MKKRSYLIGIAAIGLAAIVWLSAGGCGLYFQSHHDTLDYKPIHEAATAGDLPKVKQLVAQDRRLVAAKDWSNLTPLHLAVLHKHTDVVTFLVDHGADVNSRTSDGITPLHEAAQIGDLDLVKLLLSRGANVRAVDSTGWTPVDRAEKWQHPEVADFLRKTDG
jgi:ankyrin repeat protein